jgi:SagB-type dehydrogenase family enzyme
MTESRLATPTTAGRVLGPEYGDEGDLAELLHEASKLSPTMIGRQIRGARRLERDILLRTASARATRREPGRPRVALSRPALPPRPLETVLRRRRSARSFADLPLTERQLSGLLFAGYGVTGELRLPGEPAEQPLRTAPSGGALYPLDLYVAAQRTSGVEPGLYHFDPLAHALERLGGSPDLATASPYPELVAEAAIVVLVAAVFWRSRFKYGLRGYRFTLLEAGHVAQNVLLAATALDLGAVVLGGFYDGRVDRTLGLDGVDESTLIAICIGARKKGHR